MSAIHKENLHFYEFGPFRLDAEERLLFRDHEVVQLTPKVVDTLFVLIENRGRLVKKDELMNAIWPETFVEESSLAQNISLLRKALGEEHGGHEYIETLPRRGYRFVADVHEVHSQVRPFLVERPKSEISSSIDETESEELIVADVSDDRAEAVSARRPKWQSYAIIGCASALVVLTFFVWRINQKARGAQPPVKSIAVLPFKTMGAQTETDLAGLGMADALILRLAKLDGVTILPISSVIKYTNHGDDALAIGRELGVDAVLDGTVQRSGPRVRVTAQLIQLRDGKTLWTGKFDEQMNDIFTLQDSVSDDLVQALALTMTNAGKQAVKKRYTDSPEAYELYTIGLYFWNKRSEDGLLKAIEYFQKAIEKDPNFALAYAGVSDSYMLLDHYRYGTMPRAEVLERVKATAVKSMELDPTLPEAYVAVGVVHVLEGDYEGAMKHYRRAIELNPSFATAHLRYGHLLVNAGRLDEAIQQMQRAHELDPLSASINVNLSAYYGFKRQPDESLKYARLALDTNPEIFHARINLGEAYESKKMFPEAEAVYRELEQTGHANVAKQQLAYVYAESGKHAEARKSLTELEKSYDERKILPGLAHNIALVYVALGQHDDAFKWLNKAFDTKSLVATDFRYGRKLDPLRKDPRFKDLQQRAQTRFQEIQAMAKKKQP